MGTAHRTFPSDDFVAFWSKRCGVLTVMSKDGRFILGEVVHVYERPQEALQRLLQDQAKRIEIEETG